MRLNSLITFYLRRILEVLKQYITQQWEPMKSSCHEREAIGSQDPFYLDMVPVSHTSAHCLAMSESWPSG